MLMSKAVFKINKALSEVCTHGLIYIVHSIVILAFTPAYLLLHLCCSSEVCGHRFATVDAVEWAPYDWPGTRATGS